MYCIKVPEGQERREVGNYTSAFLPSYDSANSDSEAKSGSRRARRFVVPGYIFLIHKEGKAVAVPEKEWQVIEALADPRPSFVNEQGRICSGPLVCLNDFIQSTEDSKVQIQACLLDENRTFCIRVRKAEAAEEEQESLPEKQPAAGTDSRESAMQIENAALKERVRQLEEEVRNLRKTILELI